MNIFFLKPKAIDTVIANKLYEAQREYLETAQAAAFYAAQATMFKERMEWLQSLQCAGVPKAEVPAIVKPVRVKAAT